MVRLAASFSLGGEARAGGEKRETHGEKEKECVREGPRERGRARDRRGKKRRREVERGLGGQIKGNAKGSGNRGDEEEKERRRPLVFVNRQALVRNDLRGIFYNKLRNKKSIGNNDSYKIVKFVLSFCNFHNKFFRVDRLRICLTGRRKAQSASSAESVCRFPDTRTGSCDNRSGSIPVA